MLRSQECHGALVLVHQLHTLYRKERATDTPVLYVCSQHSEMKALTEAFE